MGYPPVSKWMQQYSGMRINGQERMPSKSPFAVCCIELSLMGKQPALKVLADGFYVGYVSGMTHYVKKGTSAPRPYAD